MKSVYNAAIIGLGFIGAADQVSGDNLGQKVQNLDGTHVDAYRKNARIHIVAGSSRDAGRRERFEARYGIETYADWRELIKNSSLDIVSIATYTPVHREITEVCAQSGVPVIYCEKPIAQSLKEAEAMVSACRESSSLLVINHNRRFNLTFRRLRDLVEEGLIGEVRSAHLQWGRGRLGNVGTHVFDAARMVLDREIVAVSGTLDEAGKPDCRGPLFRDPGGWGLLRFEDGVIATVCAPDYGAQPITMEVTGSLGSATVIGKSVTISMFGGQSPDWTDFADERTSSADETSMDTAVEEIVTWLDTGGMFPYPAEEAVLSLEVISGFHASHARGGAWVKLPLAGEDRDIIINSG